MVCLLWNLIILTRAKVLFFFPSRLYDCDLCPRDIILPTALYKPPDKQPDDLTVGSFSF